MDLLILAGLFILNGLLAMSEIAIVSSRKTRLQQAAQEGVGSAKIALQLVDSPSHFLSTIQVGITLIGIMSGALGEAALVDELSAWLSQFPEVEPYSHGLSLGLVVMGITYFSLIIGELAPKRLALLKPERIAIVMARPMRGLSVMTYPIVRVLSWSTDFVLWLFRVRKSDEPLVTEQEIKLMIDQGTEAGVFHRSEKEMVANVMRLDAIKVSAIMTPRMDMYYLDAANSLEDNLNQLIERPHAIVPVCRGGLDNLLGVIEAKDLLRRALAGETINLTEAIRPANYVPKSLSPIQLLEEFKRSKISLAFVVDEYGEIAGLATLKDVMEAIVGDLPTEETEGEPPEAVQRADGSWLLDGMLPVEKFKQIFEVDGLPTAAGEDYHTIGGFMMLQLGHVPNTADHFDWNGLRFEVVDMDRNRVDKVMVSRIE